MGLTKFCCCCDLRRGTIVFAWLQMMEIVMTIATLIGYLDMMKLNILSPVSPINRINYEYDNRRVIFDISMSSAIIIIIVVATLFIKGVTCISLTWGVIQKCHLYYQPWLFIAGIEVCLNSIGVLVVFIVACIFNPVFFILFLILGGLTALNWYFWFCVYTVYSKDMKPSTIAFELEYDNFSQAYTTVL